MAEVPALTGLPRPSWIPPGDSATTLFVRIGPDGVFRDVLVKIPATNCGRDIAVGNGTGITFNVPYCAAPLNTSYASDENLAIAWMDERSATTKSFRVSVHRPDGRIVFNTTQAYSPLPLPKRVADSAIAALHKSVTPPIKFPSIAMPPSYPPVRAIVLGRDGTVWIERWTEQPTHTWLLLDPAGRTLGQVTLPANVTLRTADRTSIWATEKDADDVEGLVRYRVR